VLAIDPAFTLAVSDPTEDQTVELTKVAVHEAVCAERWKQANDRLGRIEVVLAAIVLLLLVGEGSVVAVLRRLIGG
jgi:hypothetical protein